MRLGFGIALLGAACALLGACALGVLFLSAFARPPQPLPLGSVEWAYETGFTVDGVDRASKLRLGPAVVRARGEFYVVHARVLCPFGERFHWNDSDIDVQTFSGSGGSLRGAEQTFSVDEPVQALLDKRTHRPGREHVVLGASQRETLVFDLPFDVEQPALVFLAPNDPWNLIDDALAGHVWQPHRFNLRYD